MHFNPGILRHSSLLKTFIPRCSANQISTGSTRASEEIHAYIAARDLALADAERQPSAMVLNRAFLANQLVESSLRPARSPYQAQSLLEGEAARERERCTVAKRRIAQLRACRAPSHVYCAVAA